MARPSKKSALAREGGALSKVYEATAVVAHPPSIAGGAQAVPHYCDRHEEYELVTKDDLREIYAFGWLEKTLFGVGTFFFSGAFWLLIELMAHQEKFEFTAWMGTCAVSIVAGGVLAAIGLVLFYLKQQRLEKYFPKISDSELPSKVLLTLPAHTQSRPVKRGKTSPQTFHD
jgi:hypothetical protein